MIELFAWIFKRKKSEKIIALEKEIENLKADTITLSLTQSDLELAQEEIISLNNTISSLQQKIKVLNKYQDMNSFKEWFKSNIIKQVRTYNFRGVRKAAHLHLENFSQNSELLDKYESFLREKFFFDKRYDSPDKLIYELNIFLDQYVKKFPGGEYDTDLNVFKKVEHWMSPQEAYDYYIAKKIAGDCDDKGTFKYCCMKTALIYFGFDTEHSWRLKNFIVDLITYEGHYLLGWLKEEENRVVGFIPVESTFRHDKFKEVWNNNMIFKTNMMYAKIRFSFDEKTEYINIAARK